MVDPLFFMNRLVNIFPELKDELNEEKIVYGQVRFATFIKAHVVPRCEDLAQKYPNSDPMKKLCSLLDDMYANGDLDTRSLAAITLLNSSRTALSRLCGSAWGRAAEEHQIQPPPEGEEDQARKEKEKRKVVAKPLGQQALSLAMFRRGRLSSVKRKKGRDARRRAAASLLLFLPVFRSPLSVSPCPACGHSLCHRKGREKLWLNTSISGPMKSAVIKVPTPGSSPKGRRWPRRPGRSRCAQTGKATAVSPR